MSRILAKNRHDLGEIVMYLKHIGIKNIGPIDELSIKMPFDENGNPKPVIFVGKNGTGKTILLAQIVDALYEIGGELFRNIRIYKNDNSRYYYKVNGGINLKNGSNKGFSILQFESFNKNKQIIEYCDKIGDNIFLKDFQTIINNFQLEPTQDKIITHIENNKNLQQEWKQYAHFYLPAYRYEEPFWKNQEGFDRDIALEHIPDSKECNKELVIVSSNKSNESYIMNLLMDRLLYQAGSDKLDDYLLYKMKQDTIKYDTINGFLQLIKQNNEIHLNVFPRYYTKVGTRFGIELKGGTISYINQLSLGESVLFNMFVNIIRHTDMADEPKGIVIIDEIDTHLHANLQSEVLPQLIKIFPKIQFIITTHSPLFVLGMKEEFGDNFMLYDMPNGNIINPERFSEFQSAYTILQNTETFEKDLEQKIRSLNKPIVFLEGPTDVKYIKKSCELFNRQDLLDENYIRMDIIGEQTSNGTKSSNDVALKQAAMFLKANPNLIPNKILLLNDPEKGIDYGKEYSSNILFINKMPFFNNNPIKRGVENLFSQETIEKIIRRANEMIYYTATNKEGAEKKTYVIRDGCKMQVCDWLCENGTKEDFKNFESVMNFR